MTKTLALPTIIALTAAAAITPALAAAQTAAPVRAERPSDLADRVSGTWSGDVISDARGSSRSNVTITIERIGPNRVRITSDYPRLPTVEIPLERAMDAILAASGPHVLLMNVAADPNRLDLSFDDASWSGRRILAVRR